MGDVEWMFGDTFWGRGSSINPFRWTGSIDFEEALQDMDTLVSNDEGNRSIVVKISSGVLTTGEKFDNVKEAKSYIISRSPLHIRRRFENMAADTAEQAKIQEVERKKMDLAIQQAVHTDEQQKAEDAAKKFEEEKTNAQGQITPPVSWKFGDSGTVLGALGKAIAHMNHGRWSDDRTMQQCCEEFKEIAKNEEESKRPVTLKINGDKHRMDNVTSAINFLEEEIDKYDKVLEPFVRAVLDAKVRVNSAVKNKEDAERALQAAMTDAVEAGAGVKCLACGHQFSVTQKFCQECGAEREWRLTPSDRTMATVFQAPVQRRSVNGGTAAFCALKLQDPDDKVGWIGKDLSRAIYEADFYETLKTLRDQPSGQKCELLKFMFDYMGVLTTQEQGTSKDLILLVLKDLCHGYTSARMLDIKIGSKTAVAGWQGKSYLRAKRQQVLDDNRSNSKIEALRVAGFTNAPKARESLDPFLDARIPEWGNLVLGKIGNIKKMAKFEKLARLTTSAMLGDLIDLHKIEDFGETPAPRSDGFEYVAHAEYAEIVLHQLRDHLAKLSIAHRTCGLPPQKWVGSSVALLFDDPMHGVLPLRADEGWEQSIREKVSVNIFDWGRSKLDTQEDHNKLPQEERDDRKDFWDDYTAAIDRLSWEAARAYFHHFGNSVGWTRVTFTVWDFDSFSKDEMLGQVVIPLDANAANPDQQICQLRDPATQALVTRNNTPCSLTISIQRHDFPSDSRLQYSWRIEVIHATNLPIGDVTSSDPFVTVVASNGQEEQPSTFAFWQVTRCFKRDLNPVWNERFDIPVAKSPSVLPEGLSTSSSGLFPIASSAGGSTEGDDKALSDWREALDQGCYFVPRENPKGS